MIRPNRAAGPAVLTALAAASVLALTAGASPAAADHTHDGQIRHNQTRHDQTRHDQTRHDHPRHEPIRFATFNASLNRATEGELVADLSTRDDQQAANVAETIQRVDPDVVLVNEFDYAPQAVDLFRENYLAVSHNGSTPVDYPYAYIAPSNTGVDSGMDLDNDGTVGGGNDAFGFGLFPGQYGMVVYSKYPIDTEGVRTFQDFRWADMPGAMLPDDPATEAPADWYSAEEQDVVRLSSKSHWDVPIEVPARGGNPHGRGRSRTVHFLVSHPTPPTFDGAEDRNGTRNHDEIRFWADYVDRDRSSYIYDDEGVYGGLGRKASFVIAGDQNSDPHDGDSVPGAVDQLLDLRAITDPLATSEGAVEAAEQQGQMNDEHVGDPRYDTADFSDNPPGNLRVDYVLPSRDNKVLDAGVFWPVAADPLARLTGSYPFPTSDHRMVWTDLRR